MTFMEQVDKNSRTLARDLFNIAKTQIPESATEKIRQGIILILLESFQDTIKSVYQYGNSHVRGELEARCEEIKSLLG